MCNSVKKNLIKLMLLACTIGALNLHGMEKAHTPLATAAASAMGTSGAAIIPQISLVPDASSAGAALPPFEFNAEALAPIAQNLGLNVGSTAVNTLSRDGLKVNVSSEDLKAAFKDMKIQVPVSLQINAGTGATVIGAIILAKSLYEGLWGSQEPTNQNTLKEASSNIDKPQDDSNKKKLLDFIHQNRNLIGGIVGLLLLCNQQILGLFS